jgi:radical SAM/Cys-rich protein
VIAAFKDKLVEIDTSLVHLDELEILQINLGNLCNQNCAHCHVQAGPTGKKVMPKSMMIKIIEFLKKHTNLTVDITGGCPELNPDFRFLIENIFRVVSRLMVRTNLTVFFEKGLEWIPQWYRDHNVVVIASLPCYTAQNVDSQRGSGVFRKSIKAIKLLNGLGYSRDENLELHLVYNPGGDWLPGPQDKLETDYKKHLSTEYGVSFNRLFVITNAPIGRFKDYLESNGTVEQYLTLLTDNFNPAAATNIMCRNLISIDYQGILYNCDFNQALDLPIINSAGNVATIDELEDILADNPGIVTGAHCFCCTAGTGSSCTGTLIK